MKKMKYRILYNPSNAKYKVQVKTLFIFWTTLQTPINGSRLCMVDAKYDSWKEAYDAYTIYNLKHSNDMWIDVTNGPWLDSLILDYYKK